MYKKNTSPKKHKTSLPQMRQMPAHFRTPFLGSLLPSIWPGFLNSSAYYSSLKVKRMPDRIIGFPSESINGWAEYGHALIFGEMVCGGYVHPFHSMRDLQKINLAPQPWLDAVHSFTWLRDLQAVGTAQAGKHARQLVDEWFGIYRNYEKTAWQPHLVARRIINIFSSWSFVQDHADAPFRLRIRFDLCTQAAHLERRIHIVKYPEHKIQCLCGIIWAGLHLQDWQNRIPPAISVLLYELERQILPDGGHISRSPQVSLNILADLVDLAHNLSYNRMQVPLELEAAIVRLAAFVRSMRHEDGGLALFHDSLENDSLYIDTVLARSRTNNQDTDFLFNDTGFISLKADKTTAIMDLARAAKTSEHLYASPLAFELSSHGQRIIVNAGAEYDTKLPGSNARRAALHSTRAHSTLSVGQTDAWMKNIKSGNPNLRIDGDRQAITASHNGWEKQGWLHRRSLWLSFDGNELMGQDVLKPAKEGTAGKEPVTLRFHLHPNITAEHMEGYQGVVLYLPDGEKWYFDMAEGKISLGRGTWMGRANDIRDIQSIIIPIPIRDNQVSIDWRFYRLG
ncbi:MAG: heparinase II/III family protein [Alphaproteobacteria bacterium]